MIPSQHHSNAAATQTQNTTSHSGDLAMELNVNSKKKKVGRALRACGTLGAGCVWGDEQGRDLGQRCCVV